MLSNKLTFSLACVVVLLALGFATAPVMAHPVTDDNNGSNQLHEGHQAGSLPGHQHPTIMVSVEDADPSTEPDLEVVDTKADDIAATTLTQAQARTIQFDIMFTLTPSMAASAFDVFNAADDNQNRVYVQAHDGRNAVGTVTLPDADGEALQRAATGTGNTNEWKLPVTLTFNNDALGITANDPTVAQVQTAVETLITAGLYVNVTVDAQAWSITESFGPHAGQKNQKGGTKIKVIAPISKPDLVEVTSKTKGHGGSPFLAMFKVTAGTSGGTAATLMVDDVSATGGGFLVKDSFQAITGKTNEYQVQVTPYASSTADIVVGLSSTKRFMLKPKADGTAGTSLTVPHTAGTTPTAPGDTVIAGTVVLSGSITNDDFVVLGATVTGTDDSGLSLPAAKRLSGLNIALDEFFLNGGKILLIAPSAQSAKSVVISEIMWGVDAAASPTTESQWIELYNTTGGAVSLAGWKLEFLGPNGVSSNTGTVVDTVSNLGITGYWQAKGQSGRSVASVEGGLSKPAVDIISMYRDINYGDVTKTHDKTDSTENRKKQLAAVPDGTKGDKWKASERPSINLAGYRIGTPGAKTYTRLSSTPTALTQEIIINEVGNGSGDVNDWVELLNTTSGEINLKNWALSVVSVDDKGTADDTSDDGPKETNLVIFPDNDDTKLPANGILLITNTSPTASGNDLAAGVEINVKPEDQVKRGLTSLFYVDSGLKLPDSGKSLLVLRNAKDKNGTDEKLVDVGGTYYAAVSDTKFNTEVWPLQATAAGHGNVIHETDNEDFRAGGVYQREGKNSGIGEKQWKIVGFTGIGYDRTALSSAENGGTPGYANGSRKGKVADLASGDEISISEIMFDAGEARRKLAQWIELYNASMTESVNLKDWKLEIQNSNTEDVDSRLNATITFGEMTISPNQTVLIVSTTGLNSGTDHFPGTRVVNLWTTKAHRESLEMTSRTNRVLSSKGFYLKLTDADKKVVDEVGNLDGDKRTRDMPAWALPMSPEKGRRSSIIRIYEEGVALDGKAATGWVAASDTTLGYAVTNTYYGSPEDLSTPGFRGGGPLPVSLSSFRPARDKATGAVVIRWATESELDNAGFNILRSESKTGEFKVVNLKGIIPGHGTTSEKHTYSFTDTSAKPNVVYYYQIEDVSLDGKRTTLATTHLRGNVNAAGKLTTRWGDLKSQR